MRKRAPDNHWRMRLLHWLGPSHHRWKIDELAVIFGLTHASRPQYSDVTEFLPRFHQMAAEAGRAPESVPVTVWGVAEDSDRLRRHRDLGVARVVVSLPSAGLGEVLPIVDCWAEL